MDNAVKALIMAATVILGIMLLSLMVYTFRAAARVDEQYESNQSSRSIELYNSKFEKYHVNDNTIMDLIDLCGLAYSNNVDCDYDQALAIEIDIDIDGTHYTIPRTAGENEPLTAYKAQALGLTDSLTDGYGKNRIWRSGTSISIYDLVNEPASSLGVSGARPGERLTRTYTGLVQYQRHNDRTNENETVTENITVYKYHFKCKNIEYNDVTHKVTKMEFERAHNGDFTFGDDDVRAWDTDWDT